MVSRVLKDLKVKARLAHFIDHEPVLCQKTLLIIMLSLITVIPSTDLLSETGDPKKKAIFSSYIMAIFFRS